jgi:hypothetical protein
MYISVDIDIDDILYGLRSRDQKELLKELLDEMDIDDVLSIIKSHEDYKDEASQIQTTLMGDDANFNAACDKISINRWRISLEQEQLVLQIADKL